MKKDNYLIAYVYQERMLMCIKREKASVVQVLTILCVKTLTQFDKGYRGLKFISNFIIIFVSWSQDYRQFHYNYCHREENFN